MKPKKSGQQAEKLQYLRPELEERGRVASLTQQEPKVLGGSDGLFLVTDDNPLGNVS